MRLQVLSGSANPALASSVASAAGAQLVDRSIHHEGGRPIVGLPALDGDDVFVVQSTAPPIEENLRELQALLTRARDMGAGHVTAVLPFFGHARRASDRSDATDGRLVVDLLATAGADHVVLIDAHLPGIEAAAAVPVEILTAVPILAKAARPLITGPRRVVVAPDLNTVTLAERYGTQLGAPVAALRWSGRGEHHSSPTFIGDVDGRHVIVVDDIIGTGRTMAGALDAIERAGAQPGAIVVATHRLPNPAADDLLRAHAIRRLLTTDSIAHAPSRGLSVHVSSIAPLIADAIRRLHDGR